MPSVAFCRELVRTWEQAFAHTARTPGKEAAASQQNALLIGMQEFRGRQLTLRQARTPLYPIHTHLCSVVPPCVWSLTLFISVHLQHDVPHA